MSGAREAKMIYSREDRLCSPSPVNKLGIVAKRVGERDVLVRIKRAVLAGRYSFSEKASLEMERDGLTELDVAEAILNAVAIFKRVRSTSPRRTRAREYLYVIQSTNLEGLLIYTKASLSGKLAKRATTF